MNMRRFLMRAKIGLVWCGYMGTTAFVAIRTQSFGWTASALSLGVIVAVWITDQLLTMQKGSH